MARWITFSLRSNTSTAPCKAGVFSSYEISDGYTILVLVPCNCHPHSHAAASRQGFEASPRPPHPSFVSKDLHRNDSLQPVPTPAHHARSCAHTSAAKLPCDSHRGLFIAAHTIYLSNSKYGKNNDKNNVSEADTIRHPRLRASVLITDPERVIFSTQCCTMRR